MTNYYHFPNDAQPIEISRYLTSNGGQALQYIARSCRLDGRNKGELDDRISDLRKAMDFINNELYRLEDISETQAEDQVKF